MRVRRSLFVAVVALSAWSRVYGAGVNLTENFVQEYPLEITGSLWLDNPIGDVEIIGSDLPGMSMTFQKSTNGVDRAAVKDAHDQVRVEVGGDSHDRAVRAVMPPVRSPRWNSSVSFTIRVPRTVHVKVTSTSSHRIHVVGIIGNVFVKNFEGAIVLEGVSGASVIESSNGSILYDYLSAPSAHAQLSTINGNIEVHVPADSNFNWAADTLQGDFLTSLPARGSMSGKNSFRGSVNSPGGPTLTTSTLNGKVYLLRKGSAIKEARSVRSVPNQAVPASSGRIGILQTVRFPVVPGSWVYTTQIANVSAGEVHGSAHIETGAGEIEVGTIFGPATIVTLGGPLNIGDVLGNLVAHTAAGDIFVRAAREGGTITTDGGSIRLLYTGGATNLHSGGGDIIVGQASGAITADTKSGDIAITVDPNLRTQHVEAKTQQGNLVLNVRPGFGADIDATIVTSDAEANTIHSDLPGLTIKRDQLRGRTRWRATGRVNGGGEKVELYTEEGDIHISSQTVNPITVMTPQ